MAERWEIISRMAHDDGSIKGGANENTTVLLIDRRECIVVVKTENEIIKRRRVSVSQKQDL